MWKSFRGGLNTIDQSQGGKHLIIGNVRLAQSPPKHVYGTFPNGGGMGGGLEQDMGCGMGVDWAMLWVVVDTAHQAKTRGHVFYSGWNYFIKFAIFSSRLLLNLFPDPQFWS